MKTFFKVLVFILLFCVLIFPVIGVAIREYLQDNHKINFWISIRSVVNHLTNIVSGYSILLMMLISFPYMLWLTSKYHRLEYETNRFHMLVFFLSVVLL